MRALTVALLIILLKSADSFAIEKKHEQKLLSRRLLSSEQNNTTEKHLTWNEIFANAFVKKIKTIFTKQPETAKESDIVTKCIGGVIGIFERFYWNAAKTTTKIENNGDGNDNNERSDPKDEVEVIEPKYHGRIENATEVTEDGKMCPGGLVSDGTGNCVNPKNLKYIFDIPYACPFGYRRDWLGYCREVF